MTAAAAKVSNHKPRVVKITARATADEQTGELPSWDAVLARLVEADRARSEHNRTAEINALDGIAAAAWRLADQLERADAA